MSEPMSEEEYQAYLARFQDEAEGLLSTLRHGDATRAVRTDRYDERAFAQALADGGLDAHLAHYSQTEDYVEDFFADLFQLLSKGSPTVLEAAEMLENRRPNHAMVTTFQGYDELKNLREFTIGDPGAVTMAIVSMDSEIAALYEAMRRARELAEQQQQNIQGAGDAVRQALDGLEDGSLTPEQADEMLAQAKALASQVSDEQIANVTPRPSGLADAAEKATKELEDERELFNSYGMEPGELKRMPFAERRRLAERLKRNRMARFAPLIGQFKRLADSQQQRRLTSNPDEIVGVELSDRVQDLTPDELMAMSEPGLDADFWRRYTEQDLLTYKKEGVERVGRGPMVVICDESQSMDEGFGGATKEAWSKAVTLALADTCRREKREFHYVGFASATQCWSVDLTPGRPNYLLEVIRFTEHFFNGGTDFNAALTTAIEIARRYPDRKRPDFVIVSDGDGRLSPSVLREWTEYRKESGSRSWAIGLGNDFDAAKLKAMSDDLRSVLDLTDSREHLIDLFRQI